MKTLHSIKYQSGVSLLFAMILILILTLVAVTASNVGGLQELTARNYQYNTEAFNESYAEIDAQIASFITTSVNGTVEPPVLKATEVDGTENPLVAVRTIANGLLERQSGDLAVSFNRKCTTDGKTAKSGDSVTAGDICEVYNIKSVVRVSNTSLGSAQDQLIQIQQ